MHYVNEQNIPRYERDEKHTFSQKIPLRGISEYLSRQSTTVRGIISVVSMIIVGGIDYLTGPEISLSLFYLISVFLAAWFVGKRFAFAVSILGAVVWHFASYTFGGVHIHPAIAYWNTFVRFGFFVITAYLVAIIKVRLDTESHYSREDALTGVANVRSFYEKLDNEIFRARRYKRPLTLAYIDLDDFKNINDQRGHSVGDEVLQKIAHTIENNIRVIDTLGRLGGDEFALLLPEISAQQARVTIERLRTYLREVMNTLEYPVTCSIGVITIIHDPPAAQGMIKMADDLMYAAKRAGKNTVTYEVWPESYTKVPNHTYF
jgi:diguanylate cyclase (GGDEF)-like protein